MSAQTVPVPVTISPWAPSLPNSDAWILTSTIDDAGLKQVAALPGLSFGSQTAMSVATAPYNAPPSAVSISTAHSVPATQPRRSLAPIGRGHPSSSKRSTSSVQPAAIDAATAPTPDSSRRRRRRILTNTPAPRPYQFIHYKATHERFPARTLYTIAEEPSVRFITTNTPASPRCAEEHSTPAPAPWSKESNHDSSVMTIRFQTVNGVAQSVTSWVDEVEEEIFEHDGCAQKLYRSWADEVDAEMERDAVQTGSNELVWKEGVAVKFSMRVGFGPVFLF